MKESIGIEEMEVVRKLKLNEEKSKGIGDLIGDIERMKRERKERK